MINYASAEHLKQRQRQSWICGMEHNSTPLLRLSPQSCGMDKKNVMHDLVHERMENPINRQQSMEANFNNSLSTTTMSSNSSHSSHNTLQLARLEQQRIQMRMCWELLGDTLQNCPSQTTILRHTLRLPLSVTFRDFPWLSMTNSITDLDMYFIIPLFPLYHCSFTYLT